MNRPTRFYSKNQENTVAKAVGGKRTANSGATRFVKGDVITDEFLIEAKTVTKHQKTFTIKEEWFKKNRDEAFAMRKPYSAIVFNFGPNEENHYIINEKLFKTLQALLESE